jgi:hypothetical protein
MPVSHTSFVNNSTARRAACCVPLLALVVVAASTFTSASAAVATQGPVGLGTATSFAVLAGSGVTNTGATTVSGDIGTFPTPSESGFGTIAQTGTNHDGDAVTRGAKNDLVTAYDDAAGRKPVTSLPVELGGSSLHPGVYASPTFGLTGTLTLDAQGNPDAEFIFHAASTLTAETNSRVRLINGADACNVVWQVGSSATFKTRTQFVGDVLALTSITAQDGADFQGRLLARNGAVTLDHNVITNAACSTSATSPSAAPSPILSSAGPVTTPTDSTTPVPASSASTVGTPVTPTPQRSAPGASSFGASTPPTSLPRSPGGPSQSGSTPNSPPSTTLNSPRLPFTGANVIRALVAAVALLSLGALGLVTGRRRGSSVK